MKQINPSMKKRSTGSKNPPLTTGQWWQVKDGYVQIMGVGKMLVEYKMLKNPAQKAARTQIGSGASILDYLKTNKAKLVTKPAAPQAGGAQQ